MATHKDYRMPDVKICGDMYLPIKLGANQDNFQPDWQGDNTGDNISDKNPYYCELTALYWGWKNLPSDIGIVGLAHYRRHFSVENPFGYSVEDRWENILTEKQLDRILNGTSYQKFYDDKTSQDEEIDLILPNRRHYWIESNESHYRNAHITKPLDLTREVLFKYFPAYIPSFEKIMRKRSAHMFNMFIARRPIFNEYCEWMFSVLFKLEEAVKKSNIKIDQLDKYESRFYGFISELLLDTWIDYKEQTSKINTREIYHMYVEDLNWFKKIWNFIKRKFIKTAKTDIKTKANQKK
ncbi:MAG: DUF4422 domain-containing protein [Candidatus Ancillula sp.]|nr:DUF4422 domain-containing protein [Candidatus Ancillula sp.]